MCNLYSITKGQQAICDLAGAMRDLTGTCRCCPACFPIIPIVRTAVDGVRELAMARWGPSPAFAIEGKKTDSWRHQHPQRQIVSLAAMARRRKSLHRPLYQLR